jgi:hypothetical protein
MKRKMVFTPLAILVVVTGALGSMMVAAQEVTPEYPVSALQTGYPAPTEISPEDDPDDFAYFTLSYQQEAVDLFLGKAGVFMPISYFTGTAVVYRIQQTPFYEDRDLDFVERFLDLHAFTVKGVPYSTLWGVNYVYFNLTGPQRQAWEEGILRIYFYNDIEDEWVECPTFLIENKNEKKGRLACIMPGFGLYGLALEVDRLP